ncbi:MAG: C40 family peptidase [Clostridiales bacterium]|nr:C40 family peptidase [Clostridiales bacterium]MBR5058948.1 C40 family peptidase [Clostridiales bacterium]
MSCNYANIKVGCKYVYGASGPDTFDCGGLVRYISKLIGVTLPSDCAAEDFRQFEKMKRGYPGQSSNCKPGDYLYYQKLDKNGNVIKNGRYRDIYHASVYVGNGKIVEASSSSDVVVKRPRSTYKTASEIGYADAATVF